MVTEKASDQRLKRNSAPSALDLIEVHHMLLDVNVKWEICVDLE